MLLFSVAVAAGALAYYFLRGESEDQDRSDSGESGAGRPRGTAKRNRQSRRRGPEESEEPGPRENARDGGPDIHRQKVSRLAEETLQRAEARAEGLLRRGHEALAWESRFLSVSCREMFASEEFFGRGQRFDSYQAALQAAEDARDKLIERRRQEAQQKEMAGGAPGPGHIESQYLRHAAESALMIGWCAGGLVGRSRLGAARELFCVSVSREDTRSWKQFDQVLRKEREHCLARLQGQPGETRPER